MLVRVLLTVPGALVHEPLLWELNRTFPVVTNLRGTSITASVALVALDIVGEADKIQEAIEHLRARGVKVQVNAE